MKKALIISVSVNLTLLIEIAFLWPDRRQMDAAVAAVSGFDSSSRALASALSTPKINPTVKVNSFHWSRLESADYHTYISNLRGIGCPEQTIRDIIAADVDSAVYAPRREQIRQSRQAFGEMELQRLNNEETAMITTLLGWQVSTPQVAMSSLPASRAMREHSKEAPIVIPLILQNVDLSDLGLDSNRVNVIATLRQRFLAEIGGTNQDPMDPVYRERWQQAQADANSRLEAMIGLTAYRAYEMKARWAGNLPDVATGSKP